MVLGGLTLRAVANGVDPAQVVVGVLSVRRSKLSGVLQTSVKAHDPATQ